MIQPINQLNIYEKFLVRSKSNILFINENYDLVFNFYKECLIKENNLISVDSITLEGKVDNELHTIWYTNDGIEKPYSFYQLQI